MKHKDDFKNNMDIVIFADLKVAADINELANKVTLMLKGHGLDVLINNAGISSKFTKLKLVKEKDLTEHFGVNTIAPILMTKV